MTADDSLGAIVERADTGWLIRLPVRREEVRVEKRTVVAERLVIGRREVQDVQRVEADLRREELRVAGDSDVDRTQRLDSPTERPAPPRQHLDATAPMRPAPAHDTLAGNGMEQEPTR